MAKKPNIRFAGFEDDWEQRKVGDYLTESREIGNKGDVARKMTVKLWGKGVYEKLEAGSTNTQYFIRHANQFIYSKLDFLNCAFGVVPEELESLETTADVPAFDCVYMNPYFMFYRAIQPSFYIQNGIIANGSRKAKRIHTDTFLEMPISVPCLTEQNKIVGYFQSLDHLITLHQRKCDELKKVKKFMLQKMFPKKGEKNPEIRFDGFTNDWEQRKVYEMFKVTRGYVLPATDTSEEISDEMPYPVYSSQTKDNGLMGYYSDYLYEDAITWTTDGANAGTVNFRYGRFYCTNVCGVLLSDKVEASKAVAEALNNVAKRYVSYVGNPKLMNNVMADIQIKIPTSREERAKISSYFSNLDHLITLHQRKCEELKNVKKYMLQNMFAKGE